MDFLSSAGEEAGSDPLKLTNYQQFSDAEKQGIRRAWYSKFQPSGFYNYTRLEDIDYQEITRGFNEYETWYSLVPLPDRATAQNRREQQLQIVQTSRIHAQIRTFITKQNAAIQCLKNNIKIKTQHELNINTPKSVRQRLISEIYVLRSEVRIPYTKIFMSYIQHLLVLRNAHLFKYLNDNESEYVRRVLCLTRQYLINARNVLKEHTRRKRSVLEALNLVWNVVEFFQVKARDHKLTKIINSVIDKTNDLQNKVVILQNDLIGLTTITLHVITKLQKSLNDAITALNDLQHRLNNLADRVEVLEVEMECMHLSMYFLTFTLGRMIPAMQNECKIQDKILELINRYITALRRLATGYLDKILVSPAQLEAILNQTKDQISEHFPQYLIVFEDTRMYYQIPMVRYRYENKFIYRQIPLYLHNVKNPYLDLFLLRTVPVPVKHSNNNTQGFTKLVPRAPLLALSASNYIQLQQNQIATCIKVKKHLSMSTKFSNTSKHTSHM